MDRKTTLKLTPDPGTAVAIEVERTQAVIEDWDGSALHRGPEQVRSVMLTVIVDGQPQVLTADWPRTLRFEWGNPD